MVLGEVAAHETTMTDTLTPAERSKVMARVRGKNTKPELAVRRQAHAMGFRYRLHDRRLPGTPDLVFPGRRKVVLVHGCFWHRHEDCALARLPKTRRDFWEPKLRGNKERDQRNMADLENLGWQVLVVWECETKDQLGLAARLRRFLNDGGIE